jgi:hypothetical protein
MWRWVYGMLATYGLRPRELFVQPDISKPKSFYQKAIPIKH